MKSLSTTLLVLLLSLTTAVAYSQNTDKTYLFSSFPDVLNTSVENFGKAFNSKEGETVTLSFSDNFMFTGTVISNIQKYDNLQSMTIRSAAFGDAVFHLSKQLNDDKTISYVGRIMSMNAYDGYEIRNDKGAYTLKKMDADKIRQLCTFN